MQTEKNYSTFLGAVMDAKRDWHRSGARAELLSLYEEIDALMRPFTCASSGDCCHFARTGREPYPHRVELEEVLHAAKATNALAKKRLVVMEERRCKLLGDDGRCRVYASRPFGCRTYFCEKIEGPKKWPRDKVNELGRRIADLSAKTYDRDAGARALSKALGP
jgi:Fe-S-cluster containining protein